MAVAFDAAGAAQIPVAASSVTVANPGTGAENFGCAWTVNISGGVAFPATGVTWLGTSMLNQTSFSASLFGLFLNMSLWTIVAPPTGAGSITATWSASIPFPTIIAYTATGAGSVGTNLNLAQSPAPGAVSSISIAASAQSLVVDCMSGGTGDSVAGAGQTEPPTGQIGTGTTTPRVNSSYETGSGGTNIMSWLGPLAGSLTVHNALVIDPPVVFPGFDGIIYTAEGTNRPQEPGFPGAPAFPSFGAAAASPYDLLKKGIEVEALLNNAKFI